jgi:outer membrane protein TolC
MRTSDFFAAGRIGVLCLALALLCLAAPRRAAAQQSGFSSVDPDSALAETLRAMGGQPLQLGLATRLALENATAVRAARAAARAAEGELQRERGAFDPELFADLTTRRAETPSSSPFARPDVVENEETSTSAGARIRLPIGTEIEASIGAVRLDTNSEFASVDPEYRADGTLELRQPLLKGFGAGTSSARSAAERNLEAAQAAYRDALLATRAEVEKTYWLLYATERDAAVQLLIVEQGEALLEQARLRNRAGLVGPNQVANARVFVASQRIVSLDQGERLERISDELAVLLGVRPDGGSRYRPIDEPPNEFSVAPVESLLDRAFANNAALRVSEDNLHIIEAYASGARWNGLPSLDLIGRLGGHGLAGTSREINFGGEILSVDTKGGYAEALSQALGRDAGSWSVGVELSFPLTLRPGRGERSRLQAEAERLRQGVESVRRSLEMRVRTVHRELDNSRLRLELAHEGVDASLEQVRIGVIEYDNGRTTAFEVVRLGADLAGAQQRLSEALVRAATAAADLRYLTAESSDSIFPEASN